MLFRPGLAHHADAGEPARDERIRILGDDLERVVVDDVRLGEADEELRQHTLAAGVGALQREFCILAGERLAVGEGDAFAQRQAPDGRRNRFPRGRQRRAQIEVLVAADEGIVNVPVIIEPAACRFHDPVDVLLKQQPFRDERRGGARNYIGPRCGRGVELLERGAPVASRSARVAANGMKPP